MSHTFKKNTEKCLTASYASGLSGTGATTHPSTRILPCAKYSLFSLHEQSGKYHSTSKIGYGSELTHYESSYNEISKNIVVLS